MTQRWDTVLDVDFRAGDHRFHDLEGWAEPDWTVGHVFAMELGPVPHRARMVLRLSAATFLEQSFEVSCNGHPLGRHKADGDFVAVFPLAEAAIGDGSCRLEIGIPAPKRPCDHSSSSDERPLGLALDRIELLGTDASVDGAWPRALPDRDAADLDGRAILSAFESLGDNCEFGFVQKRLGITSSALLRFCATPVDRLLDGLAHGFSGIAEPRSVAVVVDGVPGAMEYQIRLSRYDLHYHTLVFTHEAERDDVLRRELSKLSHKHAKFVTGLASGDRIYVLKRNDGLPLATVWSVWLALQRFGPNTLLSVRVADEGEPAGQVRVLAPGLMEATVTAFADYTDATLGRDDEWIGICRLARKIAMREAAKDDRRVDAGRLSGARSDGSSLAEA